MDKVFFMVTFCLSLAFTAATTPNGVKNLQNFTTQTSQNIIVNTTTAPSSNSSERLTISTTLITGTTVTSAVENNNSSTINSPSTTAKSNYPTTLESTTKEVVSTNRIAQSTDVTTSVSHTAHSTTASHQTTTAANSSAVNVTSQSVRVTQGVRLSQSDKSLTITFSVILGIFVLAVVAFKLHRCSHKLQFLHQPLNNGEDLNVSTADPDTLIISEGACDGHPIYDNVPPARQDESQFRLEFLH